MNALPLLMAVVIGAGAAAIALLLRFRTGAEEGSADEVWTVAARRVGGEVQVVAASWLTGAQRTIRVTFEGVTIVADAVSRREYWSKRGSLDYTRVRTERVPGMGAVSLRVWPRGTLSRAARSLGLSQVSTADSAFDAAFSVTGSPRSVSAAYLDDSTRDLLTAAGEGFDTDEQRFCVEREGLPGDASTLADMIHFVERLVERWMALGQGPARVAVTLGLDLAGPLELGITRGALVARGTRRGAEVTLALRIGEDEIVTIVKSTVDDEDDWALERDGTGALARSVGDADCPASVLSVAHGAPPGALRMGRAGNTIEVVFEGLSPDPGQVTDLLDAVVDAVAAGGGYR